MSDAFDQLLEATIQHLEDLRARGVRFISVSPELLTGLHNSKSRPRAIGFAGNSQSSAEPAIQTASSPVPVLPSPSLASAASSAISRTELSPEAKATAFAELRQRAL